MDIKALLIESVHEKRILSGIRRVYFDQYCYIITYVFNGIYLNIVDIKRKRRDGCLTFYQKVNRNVRLIQNYKMAHQKWLLTNDNRKETNNNCIDSNRIDLNESKSMKVSSLLSSSAPPVLTKSTMTDIVIEKNDVGLQTEIVESPRIKRIKNFEQLKQQQQQKQLQQKSLQQQQELEKLQQQIRRLQEEQKQRQKCHKKQQQTQKQQTQQQQQQQQQEQQQQQQQQQQQHNIIKKHVACNTTKIVMKHIEQQTLAMIKSNKMIESKQYDHTTIQTLPCGCQTEFITYSQGIQCKYKTTNYATQTNQILTNCVCTQVWQNELLFESTKQFKFLHLPTTTTTTTSSSSITMNDLIQDLNNNYNYKYNNDEFYALLAEQKSVVFILNEIGALIVNQNHMLINNSELLHKLNNCVSFIKRLTDANTMSSKKQKCNISCRRNSKQQLALSRKISSTRSDVATKRSQEIQCVMKMVSKETQTTARIKKFFNKNENVQEPIGVTKKVKRVMINKSIYKK